MARVLREIQQYQQVIKIFFYLIKKKLGTL